MCKSSRFELYNTMGIQERKGIFRFITKQHQHEPFHNIGATRPNSYTRHRPTRKNAQHMQVSVCSIRKHHTGVARDTIKSNIQHVLHRFQDILFQDIYHWCHDYAGWWSEVQSLNPNTFLKWQQLLLETKSVLALVRCPGETAHCVRL